jgi:hypothetical protein
MFGDVSASVHQDCSAPTSLLTKVFPSSLGYNDFKGTVSRDFLLLVFYESVTPQPQSITLGPFRIFSKIRGDIRSSRLTTGVADTGGN